MSFSEQFRRNIGKVARESLDESLALPAEEVDATLAEPVAAEIEQEVVAPADDIADGTDAMMEADADADTLDNTAAILEGTTDNGGAGTDAAGAELATMTVERIANKYSLPRIAAFSKESFGKGGNRRQMSLSIAKEAAENADTLRKRVTDGFKKIIEWITELIKNIFSKRSQLVKRCAALQTRAAALPETQDKAAKIKLGGAGLMFKGSVVASGDKVPEVLEALPKFIEGLAEVKSITEDTVKSMAGQSTTSNSQGSGDSDFNPNQLGGFTLKLALDNGKYVVNKESAGETEAKEAKPLDKNDCVRSIKAAREALAALAKGEADLKAAVAAMNGGVGKLRTLVTGKDGEGKADRSLIFARYSAVSKLSGFIAGTTLTVVAAGLGAVEKSFSTFKAAEAKK